MYAVQADNPMIDEPRIFPEIDWLDKELFKNGLTKEWIINMTTILSKTHAHNNVRRYNDWTDPELDVVGEVVPASLELESAQEAKYFSAVLFNVISKAFESSGNDEINKDILSRKVLVNFGHNEEKSFIEVSTGSPIVEISQMILKLIQNTKWKVYSTVEGNPFKIQLVKMKAGNQ